MNGIKHMNKWMHNITEWSTSKLSLNDLKGFLEKTTFKHLPLCLRDNSKNLTRRLRNLSAPQLSLTHDLRMTYASLARPCAHQGFQRLFLMPYAEACAPLTQPFRPRFFLRRKNENAYAMLARCLRNLPPATFSKCAQIFCLRGRFRPSLRPSPCLRGVYALLTPCLCSAYAGQPVPDFLK